ncbi:MAG: hypothetical protein KAX28_00900 [Candidatus Marinimicrobia bacterium]|nr:hypothetical protein [Candidatus Neomarinimicrobiota bacterium]
MKDTSHKDRVNKAIAFHKPDRTPRDFAAVPEIWKKLSDYFGTEDRNKTLEFLDVDCRIVSYDSFCQHPSVDSTQVDLNASMERSSVGGMWRKVEPDGSNRDIWGAHRKKVPTPFGALDQFASYPLESAESLEDLKRYNWPQPDWWNFKSLRSFIYGMNDTAIYNIRYRVGSVFETSWSLYNFEKFLLDLAMKPAMPLYVMERIAEIHIENLHTVLNIAGDLIDIVYFYDDIASQEGLLISPQMYEDFVQPFHQRIIDIAHSYGKPTMMHCCGSVYSMIERFIDMRLAILNPIQPSAKNMNPERLSDEFGGRIAFHGGIDIQQFLPVAKPKQVKEKVKYTSEILGKNGGYIIAGSHHIQADTPIENVLAMYGIS